MQVASEVVQKDWKGYDFFITVRSDSPIIGGPSAGAAMTVAIIAALEGWDLDPDVIMSGTINPDETVGPVGGLYQKAEASSKVASLFLIPEGQATILVEDQKLTKIGPFTSVSTTQREVNLIEEGRKMGLEVREVYDIRDAVFYFTGKRIEVPHVEAQPIRADFMKPYAEKELSRMEEEYKKAEAEVNSYTGQYRQDLLELLKYAEDEIKTAEKAYNAGTYYTSMSASSGAGLTVTYTVNLLHYFEGTTTEVIFADLNQRIEQIKEEIRKEPIMGMTSLQCIATAQNRIYEAEKYSNQAQESDSVFKFIEYSSYAQREMENAEFWLNLSREYKGNEIDETSLKDAASSMVNTARLSLVYASSILPENDLLTEAQNRLGKAETEFAEQAYAASLFTAAESNVYSEVALIAYASQKEMVTQRIERAKERAAQSIEMSRNSGIEPVVAVSFYEVAGSLGNSVQALIYLRYSEEVASLHKYVVSHPQNPESESPVIREETERELPGRGMEGNVLFLIAGIFCGLVIYWVVQKYGRPPG